MGLAIDSAIYYSDGEWAWPGYFIYFLEKYEDVQIDEEFIAYFEGNDEKLVKTTQKRIDELSTQFGEESCFIGRR